MSCFVPGDEAPPPLEPALQNSPVLAPICGNPLVSIVCLTYNHAPFIESAIRGFLAQETNFNFEIIVLDDASTDGTSQLLENLSLKYPGRLLVIRNSSNMWRKKGNGATDAIGTARGELIALCEGDDYWIRSDKLQLQVELIRSNPTASAVTSGQINVENGFIESLSKSDGGTRTLIFWKKFFPLEFFRDYSSEFLYHDSFLRSVLLSHGKILHLPLFTAVWRRHSGGIHGSLTIVDDSIYLARQAQTRYWTAVFFRDRGSVWRSRYHLDRALETTKLGLGFRHFSIWKILRFLVLRVRALLRYA